MKKEQLLQIKSMLKKNLLWLAESHNINKFKLDEVIKDSRDVIGYTISCGNVYVRIMDHTNTISNRYNFIVKCIGVNISTTDNATYHNSYESFIFESKMEGDDIIKILEETSFYDGENVCFDDIMMKALGIIMDKLRAGEARDTEFDKIKRIMQDMADVMGIKGIGEDQHTNR